MSDNFFYAFCWSVAGVNNSTTECLVEFQTNLLCFEQINIINFVEMPLVMNVRNEVLLPTFLVGYRFALSRMRG